MAMVYASPPPRRARRLDSQDDLETQVYVRPTPQAWRNVFLEPWTPQDPPLPWSTPSPFRALAPLPPVPPARAAAETLAAFEETVSCKRPRARRRSIMPWVVFLAAFGIAFGIGKDRALRTELVSELRVATARTLAVLETSAVRLGRQVAELR